jgi:hypothetical protein
MKEPKASAGRKVIPPWIYFSTREKRPVGGGDFLNGWPPHPPCNQASAKRRGPVSAFFKKIAYTHPAVPPRP